TSRVADRGGHAITGRADTGYNRARPNLERDIINCRHLIERAAEEALLHEVHPQVAEFKERRRACLCTHHDPPPGAATLSLPASPKSGRAAISVRRCSWPGLAIRRASGP